MPHKLAVVAHACDPSTGEVEAGESRIQCHLKFQGKFKTSLSYKKQSKANQLPKPSPMLTCYHGRPWKADGLQIRRCSHSSVETFSAGRRGTQKASNSLILGVGV